jgi:hypothetical protein
VDVGKHAWTYKTDRIDTRSGGPYNRAMEAAPQAVGSSDERYRRTMRYYHMAVVAACAALLVVSALLTPDPRGYGTHERLHMPPCTFQYLTHIRCPFCGMTTSFAYLMHLRPAEALRSHPAGPVLLVFFALQIPYRLLILSGKHHPLMDRPNASDRIWQGIIGLAVLGWLIRLLVWGP